MEFQDGLCTTSKVTTLPGVAEPHVVKIPVYDVHAPIENMYTGPLIAPMDPRLTNHVALAPNVLCVEILSSAKPGYGLVRWWRGYPRDFAVQGWVHVSKLPIPDALIPMISSYQVVSGANKDPKQIYVPVVIRVS